MGVIMKVLLVLCVASQALGQTDLTANPETVKVDFEETIVACAGAGAAANTNSPLVAKIQAAFDNCRQYEKQPKGKSLLNRQSKGKKGRVKAREKEKVERDPKSALLWMNSPTKFNQNPSRMYACFQSLAGIAMETLMRMI